MKENSKMERLTYIVIAVISLTGLSNCSSDKSSIVREDWGTYKDKPVFLYTITNSNGSVMKVINYGAIITSVIVPDKNGVYEDVVMGFDSLQNYIDNGMCVGAVVGRVANVIKDAKFEIDGIEYKLKSGNHGGGEFHTSVWDSEIIENESGKGIRFHHFSPDGSIGYPGNLNAYVTYFFTDDDAVHIMFEASADKATHVNMTQHSYFNLIGNCKEPVFNHLIKIDADNYATIDERNTPLGTYTSVKDTTLDLTTMKPIKENIHKFDRGGYHFCYVFNRPAGTLEKVIEVVEPESGRTMDVYTTQPGVQFYTGNTITKNLKGKQGAIYDPYSAFCLETEHIPNTPNCPDYPSTLVRPDEIYKEICIYDFGVVEKI